MLALMLQPMATLRHELGHEATTMKQQHCVQYVCMVCDNITLSFRFVFVYTERSNRSNGRSILFVCLTAFWQNEGKTIARKNTAF